MRAIRGLNYASSTKVLLHCKERFWETQDDIIGGASFSDKISRSTYYPSDNAIPRVIQEKQQGLYTQCDSFQEEYEKQSSLFAAAGFSAPSEADRRNRAISEGPGVLVGSYNWGQDARRLGSLSSTERANCVMDAISGFHPNIRQYVDDSASMFWDEYKWARGAFCFMRPGDLQRYYQDSIRPEGHLFFAGEHCSLDQAWIQGALISSLRAVEEILKS